MTVNKFCPVAQGEYYNIKSQAKSQLFFPFFPKFFLLCVQYLHFVIINSYKRKILFWDAFFLSARTIFRFWPLSRSSSYRPPSIQIHPKQYDTYYNKASIYYSLCFRFTLPDTKNQPEDPENICHKHHTASPDHGRENEHGIYKRPAAFWSHELSYLLSHLHLPFR